ncbi:MAG: polyhydroxyalkanoate synthesis repressor PhaR [Comamonadaceae bacterium]|nr:polyhydroxyalkanoate synthesis repressor PhaR [Pseudomonadota bacterium]MDE2413482.1 polyhydroxyalkanoate synthesis repressor PhaR [Comamonadaceae bacterium]
MHRNTVRRWLPSGDQGIPAHEAGRACLKSAALQYKPGHGPEEPPVPDQSPPNESNTAQRVIKKYPNRRLYDTSTSTYVTLAEVKQLVMNGESVAVRDAKSGEDLTRSILLQIILEEEAGGAPMFSEAVLANIIRFYGHAMQGFMGTYLEKNVQLFTEIQAKLTEQSQGLSPEMWSQLMSLQSPVMKGLMGNYVEQSQNMFQQMQEQMQKQTEQMLGAFGIKKR